MGLQITLETGHKVESCHQWMVSGMLTALEHQHVLYSGHAGVDV